MVTTMGLKTGLMVPFQWPKELYRRFRRYYGLDRPVRGQSLEHGFARISISEDGEPAPEIAPSELEGNEVWDDTRINLAEKLWGEGCLGPCGAEYLKYETQLVQLDQKRSMLQIGAGLGGATRAVVDDSGVWVTAYDEDSQLAEIGTLRARMAGMVKKAGIKTYKPHSPRFKENSFNAAVSCDSLLYVSVEDKEKVIASMAKSLRVDGYLIMTEWVLAKPGEPSDEVKAWIDREPRKPYLWTAKQTVDFIQKQGMDLRISKDMTDDYRKMVIQGWAQYLADLTKADLPPEMAQTVLDECEYWIRRMAALEKGDIRVYRFVAIKLPVKTGGNFG